MQTMLHHVTLNNVKGTAKLIIFYTSTFVISLLAMSLFTCVGVWVDAARHIPSFSIAFLPEFIKALSSTVSFALYVSILSSLSYSVRRNIKAPLALSVLLIISAGYTLALGVMFKQLETLNTTSAAENQSASTLGYPGLMLDLEDITIILLEDPSVPDGSRVVSIPGQPLIYQEIPAGPGNTILPLPSAAFQEEMPYFLKSIMLDFSLASKHCHYLLNQNRVSFIIYIAALCFLLCSLRFLFTVSRWHLANLFLGALVFRGILTLEIFLGTDEIIELIQKFIGIWLPAQYAGSIILAVLAVLVLLYSVLAYFARGRLKKNG